jgi:hypothetical protein
MIEAELDDESEGEDEEEPHVEEIEDQGEKKPSPYVYESPYEADSSSEDRKDQGFTRPKVLILTGYKKMAYQIVNEIIIQFNYGSWKKIIRKKRFKQEFDLNSEEAVND